MADAKISALPAASAAAAANELAINEAGTSKKLSVSLLKDFLVLPRSTGPAGQTISAAVVTYLTGSGIQIPAAGMVVGQVYRWQIFVSKTAAGTAAPIWTFRVGTLQNVTDATVLTVTSTAQVATASGTLMVITAQVRTVSATVGVVTGAINTGAASFGIGGAGASGSINNSADGGKFFGLCVNTGLSAAWTVHGVLGSML